MTYPLPRRRLAALTAAFTLLLAGSTAFAQKKDEPSEPLPAPKSVKPAPARVRMAQPEAIWRLALHRLEDPTVPVPPRAKAAVLLGILYSEHQVKPATPEAVGALIALINEVLMNAPLDDPATAHLLAGLTTALGQLADLDRPAAVATLSMLLLNRFSPPPPPPPPVDHCGWCGTPYAQAGPVFNRYLFAREYRIAAARALGKIGTPEAVEGLTDTLSGRAQVEGPSPGEQALLERADASLNAEILDDLDKLGQGVPERNLFGALVPAEKPARPTLH